MFNLGLLCSKTFDDAIFEELFRAKYGIERSQIVKMNIKGVFQLWLTDGTYREVNLKECHAWTREGCTHCPDFAAEHADISCGGIGENADWTLTIVRTELGREIITRMIADGSIEARPGDSDPGAIALMRKLAEKSRVALAGRPRSRASGSGCPDEGLTQRLRAVAVARPTGPVSRVRRRVSRTGRADLVDVGRQLDVGAVLGASACCSSNSLASAKGTVSFMPSEHAGAEVGALELRRRRTCRRRSPRPRCSRT